MKNKLRSILRHLIFPSKDIMSDLHKFSFSNVLDIGSGTGFFLEEIQKIRKDVSFIGIEVNSQYFKKEEKYEIVSPYDEVVNIKSPYDLISFVDVLHHVKKDRYKFVEDYIQLHLKAGGLILIKEMSSENFFCRWMNRIHDLIFAFDLINEVSRSELKKIKSLGKVIVAGKKRIFLYDHYWLILRYYEN